MTIQEAKKAAFWRFPVVLTLPGCDPVEYARILQIGINYGDKGFNYFVQLLDKCGRSVVNADPAHVEVKMNGKDDLHESS